MLDKNVEMGLLLDFYSELLTKRQKDAMELYYNENLSLTEIAEEFNITKQAVSDIIKRSEKLLYGFEEKLGLLKQKGVVD